MAMIDDDGFIRIAGRMCRFSKIGGEVVPHILVEQEIPKVLGEDMTDEPEIVCAVTSVPDEKKGERLIALHKPMKKTVREITDRLQAAGLPNLFILSSDSFIQVDSIPLLGTGKLDLRGIKVVAMERCKKWATLRSKSNPKYDLAGFTDDALKGGQTIGASDPIGGVSPGRLLQPGDVVATIFQSTRLMLESQFPGRASRLFPLVAFGYRKIHVLF